MAETGLDVFGWVKTLLRSAAAGSALGHAALFAVKPVLTEDAVLLAAATLAAERAGATGVAVVTACLVFTSVLLSLGSGFLLAAMVMKLLTKGTGRLPWLVEATAGASVVVAAVTTGLLGGMLPPWIYLAAQGVLVLIVYSHSNINDVTTALLIIFTTLYLSVLYGRVGFIAGFFSMGLTIAVLCALRKALTESLARRPTSQAGGRLLERVFFYSVVVGILGFTVGLGAAEVRGGSDKEVVWMLESVLWVIFLSAGLLGAGLGTVAMVGLGPKASGRVAVGVAIITSVALRAIVQWSPSLEARSSTGAVLGAATAAGVSLGAASVAAKQAFVSRYSTLPVLASVGVGAVAAMKNLALNAALLKTSELTTVALVAVGAFVLGAPKSPFHTQVNLRRGLVTGTELIKGIGMETVTSAAAPIGAGALGAAVLGTAALGRLGTVGALVAILLALGTALSGTLGKSPPQQRHTESD